MDAGDGSVVYESLISPPVVINQGPLGPLPPEVAEAAGAGATGTVQYVDWYNNC